MYSRENIRNTVKRAFRLLRQQGFIARGNYKCCMGCAVSAIAQDLQKHPETEGVAYWHRQDDDALEEYGFLMIRFFDPKDKDSLTVGKRVAQQLRALGLVLEWDASEDTAIKIVDAA